MKIANPDKTVSNTPYKIIKLISGEDILCKIIQEYTDAVVVEYPMSIAKHQVVDTPEHVVEHTGLQRWINFTHDKNFVIDKQKIMGFGNLAPEVLVYYKMISSKAKAEEEGETGNEEHDQLVKTMQENVARLEKLMAEHGEDVDESDLENVITHVQPKRVLH